MTDSTTATELFNSLRGRLFGLAYRMTGSRADAEDLVQEAYLRWHGADHDRIESPEAWLVTTTTRLALDRLRRLKTERDAYVGPWLPEPILASEPPDRNLDLAADLSMAFLTLLERLAPEERAVFLLHQVFDFDHAEVAAIVGKTEAACRKTLQRARERVRAERPRFAVDRELHLELLGRFMQASRSGDPAQVQALLAADATFAGDGGGKVKATVRCVVGADRVGRLVVGIERKWMGADTRHNIITVNGTPGLLTWRNGVPDRILHVLVHLMPW